MRTLLLGILFFICFSPFSVNPLSPSLNDDVLGLIVFKSDIQDLDGKLISWNEDDDSPCNNNWAGVKCNPRSNRVSELVLDGFGLSGKLGRGLLQLKFLKKLSLSRNNFTGSLTLSFAQLSNLRSLDLSENGFFGPIPNDLFRQCGSLKSISMARNKFTGPIPESLAFCSSLASLDLSGNQFSGPLPSTLWSLSGLSSLDLSDNTLEGEIPKGLNSKMKRLSLCNSLVLSGNQFTGDVFEWVGEMRSLVTLDLSENRFSGKIPDSFGKLRSLKFLNVSKNALVGNLPESLTNCANLSTFDGSHNLLSGFFPSWMLKIDLQQIVFSDNEFSGSIENTFSSSKEISRKRLLALDVSRNKLSGEIPSVLGDFESLQVLNMAGNSFAGPIPSEVRRLKRLSVLDLSENQLNGTIPSEIGLVESLTSLSLARNQITGSIPSSLSNLRYLQTVDFSFNNLTGALPKQLANLVTLHSFNISHNQLQGELPSGSFFNTIDPSSVSDNPSLCGSAVNRICSKVLPKPIVLNPNSTDSDVNNNNNNNNNNIPPSFGRGKKILSISALIAIGAAASIVVGVRASAGPHSAVALNFSGGYDFSRSPSSDGGNGESGKLVMFSGDPDFSAGSHALLNKDCELGRGGFGSVYRTVLGDGRSVAIKKLTVSSLVKSQDDFEREIKKLGKIRHDNVVALDGYYWTSSLQLLIYEFVSGGNLYKHLHEKSINGKCLSWNERYNIVLGAARGLAHLHRANIIHYNLKSSNILISDSGEPKVADYGLARLLPMLDRYVLSSKIQSALGYMAPEFACKTVKITEKCDVYGFGILVLEVVTGKRPVEYMEDDVVVLSDMVRGALEEGKVEECVDVRLHGKFPVEEAIPVVKLGLICTSQVPSARPDMAEVVNILELIRCPSEGRDSFGDFS
ncbi:probably inactive leucine-rich repeat receptor-like protein kinase at3g28040 [Phtheirospermum japonicum]|uniref:Probably inactive leucine-rich repeat receptor-like protein kinase at3g28040 n=1 Tax=Phtheirospermum japonicum TaxID=374723 RepID=A0A830BKA6_9LAMI|nr:probably inactive leucine-rich repeat receptor-like protein kinase at3g28040 [Phtheirospermum japonicum]